MKLGSKVRKAVFLIQDGIGGRPRKELEGLTELEAAETPNLDRIAADGICGIMDPMAPGIRVGTDVGHLTLFGYNPLNVYDGRGPIEAAGVGFELEEGDLALRGNFATVDERMFILDRRAGRIREGTEKLASALDGMRLDGNVTVRVVPATEHRVVVVLRGGRFSSLITAVDPGAGNEGGKLPLSKPKKPDFKVASYTSDLVNKFTAESHRILKSHPLNEKRRNSNKPPANIVLSRGAGMEIRVKSIADKFNIEAVCIAGESTVLGIAKLAGFRTLTHPKFTANIDTDLQRKADFAIKALADSDMVILHVKGTDVLSHDNDIFGKIRFIEKVDEMMGYIVENLPEREACYIAMGGDHSTPGSLGTHSGDPVPIVLSGPDVLKDNIFTYGERSCAMGGLSRITANEFFLSILDYMNVTYRFGA